MSGVVAALRGSVVAEGVRLGKATVVRATNLALCVRLDDEDSDRWVPKSQIHEDSEVYSENSDPGELVVKLWFAEKEGLA